MPEEKKENEDAIPIHDTVENILKLKKKAKIILNACDEALDNLEKVLKELEDL